MPEPGDIDSFLNEPAEALYRLISFTARDLRHALGSAFRDLGITGQQFGVLIAAADDSNISEIADQLLVDPTNVGRIIERMEVAGLVQRYRLDADRRVVWVRLLPAGRDVLMRALPLHVAHATASLAALTGSEAATLTALLVKVRHYLAEVGSPLEA